MREKSLYQLRAQNVRQLGFKIVAETSKISKIKGKMFTLKLDIDQKKSP